LQRERKSSESFAANWVQAAQHHLSPLSRWTVSMVIWRRPSTDYSRAQRKGVSARRDRCRRRSARTATGRRTPSIGARGRGAQSSA